MKFKNIGQLNTNGAEGFIKGRKYDTDLNRLGRGKTTLTSELSSNSLNKELQNSLKSKNLNKYTKLNSIKELGGSMRIRCRRVLYNAIDNVTQPVATVGNTAANAVNRAAGGVTGAAAGFAKGLGTLAENPIKTTIGVMAAPVTGGLSLLPAAGKVAGSTLKGVGEGIEKGM